jgi:hypothetical protein
MLIPPLSSEAGNARGGGTEREIDATRWVAVELIAVVHFAALGLV